MEQSKRVRHIMLSSVASLIYHILPHYLLNGTVNGKMLLNPNGVFLFYLKFLSEVFLILRIFERSIIVSVHRSLCKLLVILVRI
jgi:hypothetical protein